jgi:3-keto-5-aminohexanoate cleavage enzyme
MNPPVGLAVTLRVRMSASDAYQSTGTVSPARVLELFADVTTELMIRLDGDEGSLRGLQQVEMLAPVYVGDFIEATGVITKIGNTTRQIALEARKVATYAREEELPLTAADALASPPLVCRAVGTAVVPRAQQRRPRLVLAALPGRQDSTRLPQGNVVVTPPPHVVITPPRQTPPEIMIAASIMGGGVTKDHTSYAATTPEEVAREAKLCREAGASVVYLGVDDLTASNDVIASRMTEIVAAIRAMTDVVIIVSSVCPGPADAARRLLLAECGADIVTLATGSFNFGEALVETRRSLVREVASSLRDGNVPTVAETYELGHLEEAMALGREKLLSSPLRLQFVFGVPGALGAHENTVRFVSERVPRNAIWFAAGVGRHQRRVTETAVRLGGHVRLGLADNIYMRKGVLAEGSAPFIERAATFARNVGRQPVDPARARVLLQLVSKTPSAQTELTPEVSDVSEPKESEAEVPCSEQPPAQSDPTPNAEAGESNASESPQGDDDGNSQS